MTSPSPSRSTFLSSTRRRWTWIAALCLGGLLLLGSGCSSVRFYTQSLRGGLEVLLKRQPIEGLVADPTTPSTVRRGLSTALSARAFASRELHLPENDSYRSYSDLGRPYALWNVVAAPELSIRPVEWCFPFAGCVTYRGYFSRRRAEAFARDLKRRGLDVRVSPVTAYSTLGWFADPVLNTFVELPAPRLAALVFHELAHQRLYLPGDTTFNESFATVVELAGVERWLAEHGDSGQAAAHRRGKELEGRFVDLVLDHRRRLEEIYAADRTEAWKRWHKRRILGELRAAHRSLVREDPAWAIYEPWFSRPLNNADLAAVGAYHRYQEGLQRLLAECRNDLSCFYAAAEKLADASPEERERVLQPSKTSSRETSPPDSTFPETSPPQEGAGQLTVTFLTNEGFALSSADATVLIDAFVTEPYSVYPAVPEGIYDLLVQGELDLPPVRLALASHVHRDHFQPAAAARFLRAHRQTVFVSSPQVVDALLEAAPDLAQEVESGRIRALLPEAGESESLAVAKIRVELLRLPHSSARFAPIQNLGHVIHLGGRSVLHVGDADVARENFAPYRLDERNLDLALLPVWYFFSDGGQVLVDDEIQAQHFVAAHLSHDEVAQATALKEELRPGVYLPYRPLDSLLF